MVALVSLLIAVIVMAGCRYSRYSMASLVALAFAHLVKLLLCLWLSLLIAVSVASVVAVVVAGVAVSTAAKSQERQKANLNQDRVRAKRIIHLRLQHNNDYSSNELQQQKHQRH